MISYSDALQIIENNVLKIGCETILLKYALNQISAEEIRAPFDLPRFHNSSMDGFAILSAHTKGGSQTNPKKFIIGISAAEIMTGMPLPPEFDCIVPIENVKLYFDENLKHQMFEVNQEIKKHDFVRFKGEDYREGSVLVNTNEFLTNEKIMVLTAFGIKCVKVKKKIKVAIFSTGKELVSHGSSYLDKHQIFDSNSLYLKNVLSQFPLTLKVFPIVPDDKIFFQKTVKRIIKDNFNLIISTGAVSRGKFDIVAECLNELSFQILFHRVKIKPGKPILFAHQNHTIFYFGLPGNPISTAVGTRFFAFQFLRECFGLKNEKHFKLKLDSTCKKPFGMTFFFKITALHR